MSSPSPLLAVIIPVYKVEPYLRQCLDSVCGQTYTNLKIILVDDGSPDASGAICDEYAARDPRITVIHQENRGLSGARNAALQLIEGCSYLAYLDSDDWLELDIYARCIELLEADPELDLVQFSYHAAGPHSDKVLSTEDIQLTSTEDICRHFIQGKSNFVIPAVWSKVYRTSLCRGVTFREGYNWEDVAYTMEVLYRAKKMQLLSKVGIHYRLEREGSITEHHHTADLSPLFDNLEYLISRYEEDELFVGYVNALLVNHLWSYWSMLSSYPEAYRKISPKYVRFAERAGQRPFPDFCPSPKDYRKRRLLLRFPRVYMGVRVWLRRLRRKRKS